MSLEEHVEWMAALLRSAKPVPADAPRSDELERWMDAVMVLLQGREGPPAH